MLPVPASTFTIPSIHDDTALECRIYHPKFSQNGAAGGVKWHKKGAIIAHPYVPLGGCHDDPVVHAVGTEVLKQGFVLGTFNFRGAGGSKGRSSWTGKPELVDYTSFVGFLIHYVHNLDPDASSSPSDYPNSPLTNSSSFPLSPIQSVMPTEVHISQSTPTMTLILGGYSYGSLIATNLPKTEAILSQFSHVTKGSAEAEIRLRAQHLSSQWNSEAQQQKRRGRSLKADSLPRSARSAVFGGDESEAGTRRLSRDSRRSVDVVRRSMDRSVRKLSFRKHSNEENSSPVSEDCLSPVDISTPKTHYLLISPLLPPVSMFVTLFTKLSPLLKKPESQPRDGEKTQLPATYEKLTEHPTLAVYGDKDFFTSQRKLRRWAEQLATGPDSRFRFVELAGAGHFWHEKGVEAQMKQAIREWIGDIASV